MANLSTMSLILITLGLNPGLSVFHEELLLQVNLHGNVKVILVNLIEWRNMFILMRLSRKKSI